MGVIKIGIIGPESTGKSTLCEALTDFFHATCVPEYAREYVSRKTDYTYDDVVIMTEKMLDDLKADYLTDLVFFDTELIINKVWFLHKYHRIPDFLTDALQHNPIDYYLLCAPDIAFQPDPTRENPNIREYLFRRYEEEILLSGKPYSIIRGQGSERTSQAIEVIQRFCGR